MEYFNSIASDYDYWKKKNKRYTNTHIKILNEIIYGNKTVLDFGCGTGTLLSNIKTSNKVGYDPSEEMIRIANQKFPNIQWFSEIPNGVFDIVFSVDVIEHVNNLSNYLLELKKKLDKKGKLYLIFANPLWEPILLLMEKLKMKMKEGHHHRFFNRTIKKELKKIGLKQEKIKYFFPKLIKIGLIEVWCISHSKV